MKELILSNIVPNEDPLPQANFIGCGRLGKTIAYLLAKKNLVKIQNIYCRNTESASAAIDFIEQGEVCSQLNLLKPADYYFICTPDDSIQKIYAQLLSVHSTNENATFVHFSGSLSSDILLGGKHKVCSLHPIKSFAKPEENIKNFTGTYCAFEGSADAYHVIAPLIERIGGRIFSIQKEHKALYHAAAVFASNYFVTLANIAEQCYVKSGVSQHISKSIVVSLMQGTLNNISNAQNIADALTGPLQRGDMETVQKHIQALETMPYLNEAYKIFVNLTLEMIQKASK